MSLAKYKNKRKFPQTPEPSGQLKKTKSKQLAFVVHKHLASRLHYDLRLELGGVLKSWAIPKGPSMNPGDKRLAMMVEDHPYEYRTFEGVIPEGNYGAGNVIIWDQGTYEPRAKTEDPEKNLSEQLEKGHLTFILHGQKLKGEFALIKSPHMGSNAWLLIKKKDEYATTEDVTKQDESVVSGRRVGDMESDKIDDLSGTPEAPMPEQVKPMLATLAKEVFDDPGWLYEIKWDGYRAIGSWDGSQVELYSRNGNDFTKYKEVTEALRSLRHRAVIDGEIVVLDPEGRAHFEWLQNYASKPQGQLAYYVFDILWCDGHDLMGLPLIKRKDILKKIVPGTSAIRYSDHIEGRGTEFYKTAESRHLEGIMAKNRDSKYRPGYRSRQWLKIKTHLRQEAVIGGFTEPRGSRKHIGALILGVYEGDKLRYIGHTGGGIPTEQMPALRSQLEKLEIESSPFADKFKPNAPVHWVSPKLVAEVTFSEWTSDGHMRQPIFIGLREDKDPREVTREKPVDADDVKDDKPAEPSPNRGDLKFTHLDKVFFPEKGYTKGDLVEYYKSIGDYILPYIKDRPHSLLRQPNGINGKAFFQKDVDHMPPDWIKTVPIYSESNQKEINYLVVDKLASLLYMVQLGCIEINPWNSRVQALARPDWCVLDLDPEDIAFSEVVKVAQVIHDLCEEFKISHYPKTSGKTGIHVYIPLGARYDYEQTKQFGQLLANLAHQRIPDTTSLERSPAKRQGRVYVDYLQNRQGQTLAAPYSVRPTVSASVSTPLHWDEVNQRLDPMKFTIKNTAKRLKSVGDIWKPVIGPGVDIGKIIDSISG
ncbi:MAG: ligase [Candidatus Saccharibacteria bacterium]|nr:ligase [Candidatus Saccharibacteria bacterium]